MGQTFAAGAHPWMWVLSGAGIVVWVTAVALIIGSKKFVRKWLWAFLSLATFSYGGNVAPDTFISVAIPAGAIYVIGFRYLGPWPPPERMSQAEVARGSMNFQTIVSAIVHNLTNLTNFHGRETRAQFWPYALLLFILFTLVLMVVLLPAISESIGRMQAFAAEHPELATVRDSPLNYSITIQGNHPELLPDIKRLLTPIGAFSGVLIAFLAAATARRLHDRSKSAFWGLLPLPFLLVGALTMPTLFDSTMADDAPDTRLFLIVFISNILYLAAFAYLVVLLAGAGAHDENRFGPRSAV